MALDGAYDPDNVFAKILRGDLPATKVFEDDDALAFLDIFPQSKGHTLVIPKVEARNLFEIEPEALKTLIDKTRTVAGAVKAALSPDGVRIVQFNGAPAGQTVFHIHFHVIPMYEGGALAEHASGAKADPAELEALAERIRAAF